MEATLIILSAIIILVIAFSIKGLRIVLQAETMVIERLGRYHRTLKSGVNIIWPIIDRARKIKWKYMKTDATGADVVIEDWIDRIDLRETVYDFSRQNVITRDNVVIEIDAMIYFQVTDPVRSIYEIANLPDALEKLTKTTLRNVVGSMDLDEVLSSRDEINNNLRLILDEATDRWGVKVNRVELQDITPPQEIREAMEKQMRAERDRRAAILLAEGQKRSSVLESEGYKEAQINRAKGEAEARVAIAEAEAIAIRKISEAITGDAGDPVNYLVAVRYLEALKDIAEGENNKIIYLPYEATGVLSSLGGIKELLQGDK